MTENTQARGLLFLRLGIGLMFTVVHGGPKLFGGPEVWGKIGMAMGHLGIGAVPEVWGFLAAASEFFGGICLMLGLFVRPASVFLAVTMGVAATMHLTQGDGLKVASHAIELGIVFISLVCIGSGRYGLDRVWFGKSRAASHYTLPPT